MECPVCFRWAPGDPATGYDAADVCPACATDGWIRTAHGEIVNLSEVSEVSEPRPRMARARLAPACDRCAGPLGELPHVGRGGIYCAACVAAARRVS